MNLAEIKEELRGVLKGKTLDSIVPPLVFLLTYQVLPLAVAVGVSLGFALFLTLWRIVRRASVLYSLLGLAGIALATAFAMVMGNVGDYFLPGIVGSVALVVVTFFSLLLKRPLPMLLSHLTRGWTFQWFLRKDVYPAYWETGILWFVYFLVRAVMQLFFYFTDHVGGLTLMSTVFGFPLTIGVLVVTYVYGIARLRAFGGPGIDEFDNGIAPPYRGQTRGF